MSAETTLTGGAVGARPAPRLRAGALVVPGALLLYTALAFAAFASAWRNPFIYGIGVQGDPSLFTWFLTWYPYAATHGIQPFLTNFVDYPAGANLMWNTSMPLVAYLLWPVTATLGPLVAYDLMETMGLALSAWCGFLLLRRYVRSPVAAGIGGLLYGFSPAMFAQSAGHPGLTVAFLPPLILLILDEIVRVQRRPLPLLAAALAVATVAEFFICEEVLVATGLLFAILVVTAAALWPREVLPRAGFAIKGLLLAGVLFGAAVAWPVSFQLFGPQHITGTAHEQNVYVNDFLGFWVPSQVQWLAPERALRISSRFTGNYSEWNSYLGIPLTLLLAFTVVRWWRNAWVRLAALAGAVLAILSLGITLHVGGTVKTWLPVFTLSLVFLLMPRSVPARALVLLTFVAWLALWRVPLLDSVIPARLMLNGYLLVGLIVAVFVDGLVGLGARRVAVGAAAVAVALVPLIPRLPYLATEYHAPAFFQPGGGVERVPAGSVALVAPVANYVDVDAMYWQAISDMRFRMPEGYMFVPSPGGASVNTPPSATANALWDVRAGKPSAIGNEDVKRSIRAELAAWHVRTVIVGPMPHRDEAVALLTWVLDRPPDESGGVMVWSGVG